MNPERAKLWREAIFSTLLEIRLLSRYPTENHDNLAIIQALSDWCHNIAWFSAIDFKGFNETQALNEATYLLSPHLAQIRGNLTIVLRQLGFFANYRVTTTPIKAPV
jgi:hypothetical protein